MRHLKQEIYFPIIVLIHFAFWGIDLFNYTGGFNEVDADTMFFGYINGTWANPHRILGEIFSSWVVTVFAFNFRINLWFRVGLGYEEKINGN